MLAKIRYYVVHALLGPWIALCLAFFLPFAILFWGRTTSSYVAIHVLSFVGLKLLGIRVETEGQEQLRAMEARDGTIVVANHQSNLDMFFYGHVMPKRSVAVGKKELKWFPIFGQIFAATGNIFIDRSNREKAIESINALVERVKRKRLNLWIFPEGTRSKGRGLLPFKKGPFHTAISTGFPIQPIVVQPMDGVIDLENKRLFGGTMKIAILDPIPVDNYTEDDIETLMDRTRQAFLDSFAAMGSGAGDASSTQP